MILEPLRAPNEQCPACKDGTVHTATMWRTFHPAAGQGVDLTGGRLIKKETKDA